jgi:curved DNA-binding protein CbpA
MADSIHPKLRIWTDQLEQMNYYQVLRVPPGASADEIREAFHRFAEWFHPDRHLEASDADRGAVARIFRKGAEAYRVLRDSALRQDYDLAVARGEVTLRDSSLRPPKPNQMKLGHARSLADLCRTPAARLKAAAAERQISAGDLRAARGPLNEALSLEWGDNAELEERLDDLDAALFVQGR